LVTAPGERYDADLTPETAATQRYASEVGELWSGLSRTLVRLDRLAGAPAQLAEEHGLAELHALQYRLHIAGEDAAGLSPPEDVESAHAELAAALAAARDATGELAEALEMQGGEAIGPRIHLWRGALFRVLLARLRLDSQERALPDDDDPAHGALVPALALALALGGTIAFVFGAVTSRWPFTAVGAAALMASVAVGRVKQFQ
jgi:hypothetical protein